MGFFDNLRNNALDQVAEQRARSPKPSKKNSISPDRDLLIRVAAGGEGGAQGFQAQRDAQATQDAGVAAAAASGRFPLDLEHTPSDPSAPGGTDQLGAPPSETRLGPSVRDQLDFPLPRQPGADPNTPNDPAQVAASPFSTDEDIARALLGLPSGADNNVLSASLQDLDASEWDIFLNALQGLTDFQDRRTAQQDSVTDRARAEEAFELQQTEAAQDRVRQQLVFARDMSESGDFTPDQIRSATGVDPSQFGDGGIDGAIQDAEEAVEQTTRALAIIDFSGSEFSPGSFQDPRLAGQAGLAAEENSTGFFERAGAVAGAAGAAGATGAAGGFALGGPVGSLVGGAAGVGFGIGTGLGIAGTEDVVTSKEALEYIRSAAGVELEQDIVTELELGTPFSEVRKLIKDVGIVEDLSEEIVNGLIHRWVEPFRSRTVALEELLGGGS